MAHTESLDRVKENLNSFIEFVEQQKGKLQESENVVNRLKEEQERLAPLVRTDRSY